VLPPNALHTSPVRDRSPGQAGREQLVIRDHVVLSAADSRDFPLHGIHNSSPATLGPDLAVSPAIIVRSSTRSANFVANVVLCR
jgi:hypothetical protein